MNSLNEIQVSTCLHMFNSQTYLSGGLNQCEDLTRTITKSTRVPALDFMTMIMLNRKFTSCEFTHMNMFLCH